VRTVIGRGRGSVIYDLGDGTVLRRYLDEGHSAEAEADVMRLAAAAGVPVPVVHHVEGPEIVMDLVRGPTMLTELVGHPEDARRHGQELAALHQRLDLVRPAVAPPGLGLVHGDVHPGNVILSVHGPVLLDWTNHRIGPRALDVAITWIVLACFEPGPPTPAVDQVRGPLLEGFLGAVDRAAAEAALPEAATIRHRDPGTTATEHERINRLLQTAPGP
jgi:aminoglycoside phosphotransferase (APT) family kinase protein